MSDTISMNETCDLIQRAFDALIPFNRLGWRISMFSIISCSWCNKNSTKISLMTNLFASPDGRFLLTEVCDDCLASFEPQIKIMRDFYESLKPSVLEVLTFKIKRTKTNEFEDNWKITGYFFLTEEPIVILTSPDGKLEKFVSVQELKSWNCSN